MFAAFRKNRRWAAFHQFYNELSLSARFSIAGSVVMLVGMFSIGIWLSNEIEENVTDNAAVTTALFLDRFIAPLAQELEQADKLSIGNIRALDEIMNSDNLKNRILRIKIWKEDGLIAYSNKLELVGKRFTPSDSLKMAWSGQVVAEFNDLDHAENVYERSAGVPFMEIYSPIRQRWSGRTIAVAEFYASGVELEKNIQDVKWKSWLVVGSLMFVMSLSLFGIVHRASVLIERQRDTLQKNMKEAEIFAAQNHQLTKRIERASSRSAQLNERYLRRISAELHDGPAQLLGLASLRLDRISREDNYDKRLDETGVVRQALDEAMRDIRNICKGLSLPEIEADSLPIVIEKAIRAHEHRTATTVEAQIPPSTEPIPGSVKICVYRFIQEGLNNAFRHANGNGQKVFCRLANNILNVAVHDDGGGSGHDRIKTDAGHLGLAGLRERVESLGGHFHFDFVDGRRGLLKMSLPIRSGNKIDGEKHV